MTQTRIFSFLFCLIIYRPVGICGILETLNTDAAQQYRLGRYQQAEQLWLGAMNLADGLERATIASNLGGLYRRIGRFSQAEHHFRLCYLLRRNALGDGHTNTAIALNNVAAMETVLGKFDDAERDLRQALSAAHLQPADRGSLETNLGNLLRLDGRLAEANSRLQAASMLVDNNHSLNLARGQLAEDLRNFEQAKQCFEAALSVEASPEAAVHVARVRLRDGDFNNARFLLEEARRKRPSTETQIAILQTLSNLELAQSRTSLSAIALRQALEIEERALGPYHASVASLLEQYAVVLRKLGEGKKARRIEARAKWITERVPPRPGVSLSTLSEYRHP